jgi:hypothetical protein
VSIVDRRSGTNGIIAGILDVNEIAEEARRVARDTLECNESVATTAANRGREAAEILFDGSQDPKKSCDGISIGLGFEMKAASIGGVGPSETPDPNPCLDAGVSDGGEDAP